ncbi:putative cytoplasmic protein [Salmonella enterica subsp. arizonae]|nr:putative cytoplasmic protein [Salmonella enterica subsp. arizonae]
MHAFKLNQPVPELQPVGSVSLLGRRQQKATLRSPLR